MEIVGHQKQLQFLQTAQNSGRLSHAYIFSGPEKIGKKTAALEWLSRVFQTPLNERIAHPDFFFVAPLTDEKTGAVSQEITVGQIRELIRKLALRPSLGKYKAAIIDEAQLMNDHAQNCLLKTLEEPPGDALIILVASDSRRLFETICSRAEILQFNFVPRKEIADFAKNYVSSRGIKLSEPLLNEAIDLAFGRPGRAVDFINNPEQIKKRRQIEREFTLVVKSELPERFTYAKKIAESQDNGFNEVIEIWQNYFRNLMLQSLNKTDSDSSPARKIANTLKKIHDLSVILQTTNASPRLAIENFMLEL